MPPHNVIRAKPFNHPYAVELRYRRILQAAIKKMAKETRRQLMALFKSEPAEEHFAQDASISSQARILTNLLMRQFEQMFGDLANEQAEKFVGNVNNASKSSVKQSLKELSAGYELSFNDIKSSVKETLNASVAENVGLIKSIATQYQTQMQGAVMRSITSGNGLADLVPFLQRYEGVTLRRAKTISYDQTRKAFNNLNAIRMDDAGIEQFEWLHSRGSQHPRKLHLEYDRKIFDLKNPPVIDPKTGEKGLPGQLINCKCRMAAVVSFKKRQA